MKRLSAHAHVAVPAELCFRAVQESVIDARWREAYHHLRPGREYSGWVTVADAPRRLEIAVAAIEPTTGKRMHSLGYTVTYDFTTDGPDRTHVEIGVEYTLVAALGAMGMFETQAANEVLQRLWGVLLLEAGFRGRA